MRLLGAVSEASGAVNEDGFGFTGTAEDVSAAWIFDGVTGINARNYLPAASDAQWLVACAHRHLRTLATSEMTLPALLAGLVDRLAASWQEASAGLELPQDYDPPAACLILAKRYGRDWKALRLGDSCLMARASGGSHRIFAASPNNAFDHWLSREAGKRRDHGVLDVKALLAEFRPQLREGRARRNQPGGYSILECSPAALAMPEYIELGSPSDILLCTDGYYRAVDHYGQYTGEGLLDASREDAGKVLAGVRAAEASDPDCQRYLRFKPADDATAVMLAL